MMTSWINKPKRRRFVKILGRSIGVALLNTPNEITWYWGNLVVYVNSYRFVHAKNGGHFSPWFASIFLTFWAVAVILAGFLSKKIGQWNVVLIGSILYNIGMFSSYYAVKSRVYVLDFTLAVPCGAGYGLMQAMVYVWVKDMAGDRSGLAYGLISNCINIGAMVMNEITTRYLNPDNMEAGFHGGYTKVFVQRSVVDFVPSLFVLLGAVTTSIHVVGLFLMLISGSNTDDNESANDEEAREATDAVGHDGGYEYEHFGVDGARNKDFVNGSKWYTTGTENGQERNCQNYYELRSQNSSNICDHKLTYELSQTSMDKSNILSKSDTEANSASCRDTSTIPSLSLKQAMKTNSFYLVCWALMGADLSYILLMNFYKLFGQARIADDHFLMEVGTADSLVVLMSRIALGNVIDKYGFKNAAVAFTAGSAIVYVTYDPVTCISRWLFATWTVCLGLICSGFYIIFPVAALRLFGHEHFTTNYGAIMSTTIFTNSVAPSLVESVFLHFGWFGVFLTVSLFNLILMVGIILCLSTENRGK